MIKDIKNQMDKQPVSEILAHCVYDNSQDGMNKVYADYARHRDWQMCGWYENETLLGVCGFAVHSNWLEILHVATAENARGLGIGKAIINFLQEKYKMKIELETDDDAVDFYRKCGFETIPIRKYDVRRWTCVLYIKE